MVKFCLALKVSGSEAHLCGKHADGSTSPDAASRSVSAAVHSRCLLQHSPESRQRRPKVKISQRPGFSRHCNFPSRPFRPERQAERSAAPAIDALGARRRALLGTARPDGGARDRRARRSAGGDGRWPWRRTSATRGAPSRMTSTMAATWPRPASTSAWVRTADEWESRTAPLPPLAGPSGEAAPCAPDRCLWDAPAASGLELRSRSAQCFNLATGCECGARALFSPG